MLSSFSSRANLCTRNLNPSRTISRIPSRWTVCRNDNTKTMICSSVKRIDVVIVSKATDNDHVNPEGATQGGFHFGFSSHSLRHDLERATKQLRGDGLGMTLPLWANLSAAGSCWWWSPPCWRLCPAPWRSWRWCSWWGAPRVWRTLWWGARWAPPGSSVSLGFLVRLGLRKTTACGPLAKPISDQSQPRKKVYCSRFLGYQHSCNFLCRPMPLMIDGNPSCNSFTQH